MERNSFSEDYRRFSQQEKYAQDLAFKTISSGLMNLPAATCRELSS
jgi:hypothetical protein